MTKPMVPIETNIASKANKKAPAKAKATEEYLAKLAEDTDKHYWTLSDASEGVVMTYGDFGTMLYNANSPRFTTYTSNPNTSMIQAHLFMEYADGEPAVVKQDVEMSFNPTTLTVTMGEEFTQPTLTVNPANLRVTYESSNTDVATVNSAGVLTLVGAGYAVITASFAGNDSYNAASTSYTLTVKSGTTPGPVDPTGDTRYQLVTDASSLAAGDRVIIAHVDDDNVLALSTNQKTNNRGATTDVTLNEDGHHDMNAVVILLERVTSYLNRVRYLLVVIQQNLLPYNLRHKEAGRFVSQLVFVKESRTFGQQFLNTLQQHLRAKLVLRRDGQNLRIRQQRMPLLNDAS